MKKSAIIILFWILPVLCYLLSLQLNAKRRKIMDVKLKSPAFNQGDLIPSKYTCDGENISPPLHWSDIPDNTKSLVIISDDPDAPAGIWTHWVLFNIPSDQTQVMESIPNSEVLTNGTKQGINDFGRIGYGGPCPPGAEHRYYFRLYALDISLSFDPGATREEVLNAMEGHILGKGELMGRYKR